MSPQDLDALCERLKDQHGDPETGGFEYTNPDGPEAVATIKALIAEVRSLQVRVARWEPPMMTATASSSCSAFLARNGKGEG